MVEATGWRGQWHVFRLPLSHGCASKATNTQINTAVRKVFLPRQQREPAGLWGGQDQEVMSVVQAPGSLWSDLVYRLVPISTALAGPKAVLAKDYPLNTRTTKNKIKNLVEWAAPPPEKEQHPRPLCRYSLSYLCTPDGKKGERRCYQVGGQSQAGGRDALARRTSSFEVTGYYYLVCVVIW